MGRLIRHNYDEDPTVATEARGTREYGEHLVVRLDGRGWRPDRVLFDQELSFGGVIDHTERNAQNSHHCLPQGHHRFAHRKRYRIRLS